jgi:hypothetical protein
LESGDVCSGITKTTISKAEYKWELTILILVNSLSLQVK